MFTEIERCRLTFKVWIGGNNNFNDIAWVSKKCIKWEISRTSAMKRWKWATKYVVESFVDTRLLYREEISVFFDDADNMFITFIIATVVAHGHAHILESTTERTCIDIFVDIDKLFWELECEFFFLCEDMKCEFHCCFFLRHPGV